MQANPRDRYGGNSVPRDAHVVPRAEDAVCAAEGLPRSHALLDEESMMYLPPLVSTLLNSFCKDVTDQHTSQYLRQHHTAEKAVAIPTPSPKADVPSPTAATPSKPRRFTMRVPGMPGGGGGGTRARSVTDPVRPSAAMAGRLALAVCDERYCDGAAEEHQAVGGRVRDHARSYQHTASPSSSQRRVAVQRAGGSSGRDESEGDIHASVGRNWAHLPILGDLSTALSSLRTLEFKPPRRVRRARNGCNAADAGSPAGAPAQKSADDGGVAADGALVSSAEASAEMGDELSEGIMSDGGMSDRDDEAAEAEAAQLSALEEAAQKIERAEAELKREIAILSDKQNRRHQRRLGSTGRGGVSADDSLA